MVGLILLLLLGGPGDPPALQEVRRSAALDSLDRLLAAPAPAAPIWRARLFQALRRLDHVDDPRPLRGWTLLAESGSGADRGNLLVYQRRHRLPLAYDGTGIASADEMLEYALHLWGGGHLEEAAAFLSRAAAGHPEDARLADNLAWLEFTAPPVVALRADPRGTALAVLAARAGGEGK